MDDNNGKPWWERFFSDSNGLSWESLCNPDDAWSAHVFPWVEFAKSNNKNLPIILPRLDQHGEPSWYCGGKSIKGGLQLKEALQAFLGPSYTDFDGRYYILDPDDPVEVAFAEGTVGPAYKIHAIKPSQVPKIKRGIELYLGLVKRMPAEEPYARSPLRVLRAELDRALAVGDENNALTLLERIRAIGRLDAENLLYIDVEVKAGLGNWEGLAWDRQLLSNLSGLRLPKRVLFHVHEALYRVHVEPHENSENPTAVLAAFRAAKLHQWPALFSTRRGLQSARLLKAFFLYELTRENVDSLDLDRLSGELKKISEPFVDSLLTLIPSSSSKSVPESPLDAANEAFLNLELDHALDLYLQASPSPRRWTQLVRCAEEIGTNEAAERVIEAVDSYGGSTIPNNLGEKLAALREECSREGAGACVDGWLAWARKVQGGMPPDEAMSLLRESSATWDVDQLLNRKEQMDEFAGIVNNADGSSDIVFRESAPLIYQSLMPDSGIPSRLIKPLLHLFVTKVALFDDPSSNELELVREIAEGLLTIGVDGQEYQSLISDLQELINTQMSPSLLTWSLDLAEMLALQRCPDPESRLRLVLSVIEEGQRMSHRLHHSDILIIEQLCKDLNINCPIQRPLADGEEGGGFEKILANKRIAIYTLVEPAGQRAAEVLKKLCSTVQVNLNCDHECTEGLINLARSADLFVFAWKCSKHQAFYCIKKHRKSERPLIQPEGKGASSILRAILEDL